MNAIRSSARLLLRQTFSLSRSRGAATTAPSRGFAVRAASKALKDRTEYAADATAEQKVRPASLSPLTLHASDSHHAGVATC